MAKKMTKKMATIRRQNGNKIAKKLPSKWRKKDKKMAIKWRKKDEKDDKMV